MELDDLKNIWKQNPPYPHKNAEEIAAMLKSKSSSIIEKLKRNVWFELIFTALVGMALLVYTFTIPNGTIKWMIISILLVFILYTFYFIKKLIVNNLRR